MAVQTQETDLWKQRIKHIQNRTPEQIAEIRTLLMAKMPSPRSLPSGKTLEEVVVGQITDDLSEAKVDSILRDL